MLQAKATHLFFSEAMTEGTAGNQGVTHHPLRGDCIKTSSGVRSEGDPGTTISTRSELALPLLTSGEITQHQRAPRTPRAAPLMEPTSAGVKTTLLAVPPTTADTLGNGCVGASKRFSPYKGRLSACAAYPNCSRTRNRAQYAATEDTGPRRLRFVVRAGVPITVVSEGSRSTAIILESNPPRPQRSSIGSLRSSTTIRRLMRDRCAA